MRLNRNSLSALRPGTPVPLKQALYALAISVWLTACGIKGGLLLEEENTPKSELSSVQTTDIGSSSDVDDVNGQTNIDIRPSDPPGQPQPEADPSPQSTPEHPPPQPAP